MTVCGTEALADQFRVMPSFRDRLHFSDTMIDPKAMDTQLRELDENESYIGMPGEIEEAAKKSSNWGWWALVAPFIL